MACSDGEEDSSSTTTRVTLLDRSASAIAADALSDAPTADFAAARARLSRDVPTSQRTYARGFALGAGRGSALATDAQLAAARRSAASALGALLDPVKEIDAALAQASMDALIAEVQRRLPGATSCDALGAKADDCTAALLVLEVKRSEAPPDAGTPAGDGGAVDSGVAPVSAIECPMRDTAGARELGTTISADETWSGKILVRSSTYVTNATITIQPGTQIFMEADASIEFGWNTSAATVIAEGTAAEPIRFCGRVADRGFWNTITFGTNVTSNSVLRNVLVSDGAGNTNSAALVLNADLLVDNVQVRNAGNIGAQVADFKAGSTRLSVDGSGGAALVLTAEGALTRFPLGGFLQSNADNVARIRFTQFTGATVVHNIGVPYVQEADATSTMGTLTFEPGVNYRFQPDTSLEIGWNSSSVGVHVNGTAAAPVVFRGTTDTSSAWAGLIVGNNVATDSNLTYLELSQAGGGSASALKIDAPIRLDHVTLKKNATGLRLSERGLASGSTALTIAETQSYPVVVIGGGVYSLPTGSYTGNTIDQIRLEGGSLTTGGTIQDLGVPYFVSQDTYVTGPSGGISLTIAPGTDFVMSSGATLEIGWNTSDVAFTAVGTVAAPIRFTGASTTAGFWGGLVVGSGVRPNSALSYVEIGHGGQSGAALLDLNVTIPVTNCKFFDSAGYGIGKETANPTDYTVGNTFERIALGNVRVP